MRFFWYILPRNSWRKEGGTLENVFSPNSYVGVNEASKYLGVSSLTVRKWIRGDQLKHLVVKSPKNKKDMYIIHKDELKFFKEKIMPEIYGKRYVPKKYRRKSIVDRVKDFWEKLKNAF